MSVPLGDTTVVPRTYADLQGTVPASAAPTAISVSPPLADNSTNLATTAWVKGQGYGAGAQRFADAEIPGGTIDGTNKTFTVKNPPIAIQVFVNGVLELNFTLSTNTITFAFAPQIGDTLVTYYRF
jgi:hypothetical protein